MKKKEYLDPCKNCVEDPCPGSNNCPVANAEGFPLKGTSTKAKVKKVPEQIPPLLKRLHIGVPKQGNVVITIRSKEEDPETTTILIESNGKKESYCWTKYHLKKNIIIKFREGSLVKIQYPKEEKEK